jgi:hypothetical protein
LAILLQITFQTAKSVFQRTAETIFTTNSGAEVQKATIVNQITIGGILNFIAIVDAHFTSKSAHFISKKNQTTKRIYIIII